MRFCQVRENVVGGGKWGEEEDSNLCSYATHKSWREIIKKLFLSSNENGSWNMWAENEIHFRYFLKLLRFTSHLIDWQVLELENYLRWGENIRKEARDDEFKVLNLFNYYKINIKFKKYETPLQKVSLGTIDTKRINGRAKSQRRILLYSFPHHHWWLRGAEGSVESLSMAAEGKTY